ncbi:MAG: CBS domain-containing protein [Acidobacteriaceae bacterium]
MRGWSFPIGRIMGVEIRLHMFFALLLALVLLYTSMMGIASMRGVALWFFLLMAVAVREIARSLVAVYYGLELRNILLLPIGGLFAHATPESAERAAEGRVQTALAVVGPVVNITFAIVLGMLIAGAAPGVSLFQRPWVTPHYLLRSMVWLNIFLGLINLLPAYPLDAGRMLRGGFSRSRGTVQGTRAASGLGQILALVMFAAGILLPSPWLIMAGFFVFIGAQMEDQGLLFQSVVDTVHMRDIMLTEFSMLSASDTLEDALHKSVHSLQDDFPVVRGGNLVGVVSRQNILEALQAEGNGYVQGVMTKAFQIAQPGDSLGTTFRRITAGRGLSLVPVLEGERIVGIVTLQNLMHSMGLLAETRKLQRQA